MKKGKRKRQVKRFGESLQNEAGETEMAVIEEQAAAEFIGHREWGWGTMTPAVCTKSSEHLRPGLPRLL